MVRLSGVGHKENLCQMSNDDSVWLEAGFEDHQVFNLPNFYFLCHCHHGYSCGCLHRLKGYFVRMIFPFPQKCSSEKLAGPKNSILKTWGHVGMYTNIACLISKAKKEIKCVKRKLTCKPTG